MTQCPFAAILGSVASPLFLASMVRHRPTLQALAPATFILSLIACSPGSQEPESQAGARRPGILLITLDTTRADSLGFESGTGATPNLDALAARGIVFSHAYSTAPTTLPAHASMMTGLYPAEHGIHENARVLAPDLPLLAPRLKELGYRTAAFVSGFPLSGQFGLERGFDHYDDDFGEGAERRAIETTDRALAYLEQAGTADDAPLFLWLHYFDPHEPYDPLEPWRSRFADDPYLGEIAAMDHELGRLLAAFEDRPSPGGTKTIITGDHGEGLGDHGEALHGNLLYQGVMRVPLIVAGTGLDAAVRTEPVSIRQISATVRGWAGDQSSNTLLDPGEDTILAEAMKPHLQYGWQPQVMAVRDRMKVIRSGEVEVYDLEADPTEARDLAGDAEIAPELRRALRAYPLPAPADSGSGAALSREDQERLASLGYVDWQGRAPPREDAPSPKDMTHLFADLDLGSGLFIRRQYDRAITVFERILEEDPQNFMVCLRLAVAHSITGRDRRALELFERARRIDPGSVDLRHYLAMHHWRAGNPDDAAALFESVLAQMPGRLPAVEGLAQIRAAQGRTGEALELLERAPAANWSTEVLVLLGDLRMAAGDTHGAIAAFEQARDADDRLARDLELGVLYLADQRFEEARDSLDRVAPDHPAYPMALFKRAQVSVLLSEADQAARIRLAHRHADATTRPLIEREQLFRDIAWR